MTNSLPVIGAALPVEELETCRDWLLEKDRDLELQSFTKAEILDGDWHPLTDRAKRLLDGHNGRLGIHGPFWGLTIASTDPEIRNVVTKRMLQGLEVCAKLGATQMVVHSPYTTWGHNNMPSMPKVRQSIEDCTHATLEPVVQRAEDQGTMLVIENIEDKDPTDRVNLASSFGSRAVRVSLDTGHAHYAHCATGAPPVDHHVIAAGDLLAHVHLQDSEGYADRHWPPGDGTIRWGSVFRALDALDVTPHLVLELRDYAHIPQAMAFLEREGLGQ